MIKIKDFTLDSMKECIVLSIDSNLKDSVSSNPHGHSFCIALEMRNITTRIKYGKTI